MKSPDPQRVCSAELPEVLSASVSGEVWEFFPARREAKPAGGDAAAGAMAALRAPIDSPAAADATIPGDRIALAVDPNVPELAGVVRGCVDTLWEPGEPRLQLVLWEEASQGVLEELSRTCGDRVEVLRHRCDDRPSLSYLAADAEANPVYLNRALVDADFVLPVVAHRSLDRASCQDPAGLFPHFSDSATRRRFLLEQRPAEPPQETIEVDWLLGVQLVLSVRSDPNGKAGEIWAGTPRAIAADLPARAEPLTSEDALSDSLKDPWDTERPQAALVVASLDGEASQQTWSNATRAIAAASRYAAPGGTIVLWSGLSEPPPRGLGRRIQQESWKPPKSTGRASDGDASLTPWDQAAELAPILQTVLSEHRVLIRSRLEREMLESISFGSLQGLDELRRLSAQHSSVGVLRAAQFAGTSLHPVRQQGRG